jgi:uncharacterized protein involved in exopolysaccharide biosynthesis
MPAPIIDVGYAPNAEDGASAGLSVAQFLTIARAYWRSALLITVSVAVVAAVVLKFLPKTYTATATLIVNTENKDPLAGQQFPNDALGNYVATQTELMLSHIILGPVVDKLDLADDPLMTAGAQNLDVTLRREYAEKVLSDALQVETGRGGQLLYVSASARDPLKAARIANAVADEYLLQQRQRISQPAGERAQRYSAELAELRDKAALAQDKLTAFRKQNGITDVEAANGDSEMQTLAGLQAKLLEAQNQRRTLEAKLSGQQTNPDDGAATVQIAALKGTITALEAQLAEKQATLGPRHPAVLELNSRLDATRRSLAQEMQSVTRGNASEIASARDLEEKLSRAVADQRQKVLNLHQLQGEGQKLTLELESAQAVYKRALDGYDQIMFASAGNYTNVSFISRATPPLKASKPNKLKLLAVGVLFGFGLGLALPLCYELFVNRRLRCRDDLERTLGIPVLAQFDAIRVPAVAS